MQGEAGTGNVVEAVRHCRAVMGAIRRLQTMDDDELYVFAKEIRAPIELVRQVHFPSSPSTALVITSLPPCRLSPLSCERTTLLGSTLCIARVFRHRVRKPKIAQRKVWACSESMAVCGCVELRPKTVLMNRKS